MKAVPIGRAAAQLGVSPDTLRYYDRIGLVSPRQRGANGRRYYGERDLEQLRFIRRAQAMDYSLDEIAELLSLRADPKADCAQVQRRAESKLAEVRDKIERLEGIGTALERLIRACPGKGALGACSIMESLIAATRETSAHANADHKENAR